MTALVARREITGTVGKSSLVVSPLPHSDAVDCLRRYWTIISNLETWQISGTKEMTKLRSEALTPNAPTPERAALTRRCRTKLVRVRPRCGRPSVAPEGRHAVEAAKNGTLPRPAYRIESRFPFFAPAMKDCQA